MKRSAAILVLLCCAAPAVGETQPTIIEAPGEGTIEYTVVNPDPSTVGDIVAFAIEVDPNALGGFDYWPDTSGDAAPWRAQRLNPPRWYELMEQEASWPYTIYPLTWQQFCGGIDYPFQSQTAVGFFLPYQQSEGDEYEFENPADAVSPGETLGGFRVEAGPMSEFRIAYLGDASEPFGEDGLSTLGGQAVPEPSTMTLAAVGLASGLLLRRRRRAWCRDGACG